MPECPILACNRHIYSFVFVFENSKQRFSKDLSEWIRLFRTQLNCGYGCSPHMACMYTQLWQYPKRNQFQQSQYVILDWQHKKKISSISHVLESTHSTHLFITSQFANIARCSHRKFEIKWIELCLGVGWQSNVSQPQARCVDWCLYGKERELHPNKKDKNIVFVRIVWYRIVVHNPEHNTYGVPTAIIFIYLLYSLLNAMIFI